MNAFGEIAYAEWEHLPVRWPHLDLGAFQIMPNHMHGILIIRDVPVGAALAAARGEEAARNGGNDGENEISGATARVAPTDIAGAERHDAGDRVDTKIQWAKKPTVGQIVGAYKSCVLTECLKIVKAQNPDLSLGKIWQRNYWDEIIRNAEIFDQISQYIIHNPANWETDKFFGAE
ncbi:MAG: hypothetical protein KDD14_21900 [Saprospiraceae bacterium]|nr:hypothetical protein [Saprospiraceae bacterium]